MARLEGIKLGAYEIGERIGSGGMAEVYRAKQRTAFDREVAIKVIRKGYAEDEDFRARFLREARAISQLSHLNILPLIEFGEDKVNEEEILFLVMPYVAGGTLRDRLKKQGGPLPLRDTIRIFSQLCEAIDHAHQHGLIHRDIKPSNVLLQDGRNVLLADFGIALDTGDARLTSTGMGLGTAEYMAPEQAKGRADKRSDVYSLGVVLYVMLTGHPPYAGNTPFDVLLKHATEPLPPIRELNPQIPPQIVQVVETSMAKQPADRFQSAQAMLNAFEQAVIQVGPEALSAMQWSGSIPAVRIPGTGSGPSGSSAPVSSPGQTPPGSGSYASPSGPGSAPISGPSGGAGSTPISGPSGGVSMEDMPTVRNPPAPMPAASGMVSGSGQVDPPTALAADPPTSISNTGKTSMAPPPWMVQSGPVPAVSLPRIPAVQPMGPPPVGAPSAVPFAPPPTTPRPRNKALIAGLLVLLVVILGGAGLAAGLILTHKAPTTNTGPGVTGSPSASRTTTPVASIVFTPGSPCAQAAANPSGPNATPGSYSAASLVFQATGGSPAFLAASPGNGSVYYSDQTAQAIDGLSPAIQHQFTVLPGVPQPSGVVIPPDQPYPLIYLQQGAAGHQSINENGTSILATFADSGIQIVPGFNPLNGFALGLNPVNDALLVPSPTNGTLACLSKGSLGAPFLTGLQHPVAAAVDAQGNVYVADAGANTLMRFNAQTGKLAWTQPFIAPQDVIVDADGYLVASVLGAAPGDGSLVRLNPTTGQTVATLAKNLIEPRGLTLNTTFYHTNGIYFIDQGAATINELLYQAH